MSTQGGKKDFTDLLFYSAPECLKVLATQQLVQMVTFLQISQDMCSTLNHKQNGCDKPRNICGIRIPRISLSSGLEPEILAIILCCIQIIDIVTR